MTHNYEEKELYYSDGTVMYRGGVKKTILDMTFMMVRGHYSIKTGNYYSRVNLPIT